MLTNDHVETYVATTIVPQTRTRRFANGSIDYTFYDQRARAYRGIDFRRLGSAAGTWTAGLIARWLGGNAARQPDRRTATRPVLVRLAPQHGAGRPDPVGTSPGSYPRAA